MELGSFIDTRFAARAPAISPPPATRTGGTGIPIEEWRSATDAPVVLYFPNLYRPANARAGKGRTLFGETNTSRAPLPVLALAGVLELAGYRVRIVDAVMHEDFEAELLAATQGAICLGISSIAGYQVHEALEIAKLVRRRNPSLPIVWGGWFPTLLTEQAVRDPHVDVLKVIHLSPPNIDDMVARMKRRAIKENRPDDADEAVIRKRFEVYDKETRPVLEHYDAKKVCNINAVGTPAEVLLNILQALVPMYNKLFGNPLT